MASGTFTHLDDDTEYEEFLTYGLAGNPDASLNRLLEHTDALRLFENNGSRIDCDDPPVVASPPSPFAHLKPSFDNNGRQIFVEKEDGRGKPIVYYSPTKEGRFNRWDRDGYGRNGFTVDGPVCMLDRDKRDYESDPGVRTAA